MFAVLSDTFSKCVQCSMCSMKCTCSDLGAFAGAGAVRNVHWVAGMYDITRSVNDIVRYRPF